MIPEADLDLKPLITVLAQVQHYREELATLKGRFLDLQQERDWYRDTTEYMVQTTTEIGKEMEAMKGRMRDHERLMEEVRVLERATAK